MSKLMDERAQKMFAKKAVTPETFIKTGVGVIILNEKHEILLEKRKDCGMWGMVGGKVDPGETISQAVHRETLEETGLEVKIERLLGIYSDPKERTVTYLDNGDVAQLIDIVFIATKQAGELKVSARSCNFRE
jgi:ADP-ribose pyrophosphatase YjhB (NUDIX family)